MTTARARLPWWLRCVIVQVVCRRSLPASTNRPVLVARISSRFDLLLECSGSCQRSQQEHPGENPPWRSGLWKDLHSVFGVSFERHVYMSALRQGYGVSIDVHQCVFQAHFTV